MSPGTVGRNGVEARWQGRWLAGLAVRAVMTLVPFVLGVGTIAVGAAVVRRPDGAAVLGWYAGLCAASWLMLWQSQRVLQRLMPLAALLEMSLLFPDRAPSRLRLARRVASTHDLERLLNRTGAGGRTESTQEAAERILVLVSALAGHDRATRGHSERVRAYTDLIAMRLGLTQRDRDRLRWAALLHDIGKLHVPSALLNKPGTPSPEEWRVIRQHPHHGELVCAPLLEWMEGWGDVIVQHHEKWDGSGYPVGLAGNRICLGARIVSVADAFDVMTAARAYKKPMGRTAALRELVACSGTHFDPDVVRALITIPQKRLLLTMGPLSWLVGLPVIGQAPATIASALTSGASAVTAAAGAIALTGLSAVAPVSLHGLPASLSQEGSHVRTAPARITRSTPSGTARTHATVDGRRRTSSTKDHAGAPTPVGVPAGDTHSPVLPAPTGSPRSADAGPGSGANDDRSTASDDGRSTDDGSTGSTGSSPRTTSARRTTAPRTTAPRTTAPRTTAARTTAPRTSPRSTPRPTSTHRRWWPFPTHHSGSSSSSNTKNGNGSSPTTS